MEYPNDHEAVDPDTNDFGSDQAPGEVAAPELPTMADLDRLAADLDHVDVTLAALDRDVTGDAVIGGSGSPMTDSAI